MKGRSRQSVDTFFSMMLVIGLISASYLVQTFVEIDKENTQSNVLKAAIERADPVKSATKSPRIFKNKCGTILSELSLSGGCVSRRGFKLAAYKCSDGISKNVSEVNCMPAAYWETRAYKDCAVRMKCDVGTSSPSSGLQKN